MATVNLAPGTQYITAARQRRRRLYLGAAGIGLVLVLAWAGLFFAIVGLENRKDNINDQVQAVEREIANLAVEARRITLFEQRLLTIDSLLKNHISLDPLLQEVEKLLPPPVVLTNLKVDQKAGQITVSGRAPDIDQIAQTLASLSTTENRQTFFSEAVLNSARLAQDRDAQGNVTASHYDFNAALTFNPKGLLIHSP